MAQEPSAEEIARWDRWFAIKMNNRARAIAENPARTPVEEEEMLHAAHAAALHWDRIGTDRNQAAADMPLGQVHALLGHGSLAMRYGRRSHDFVTSHESPHLGGCVCPCGPRECRPCRRGNCAVHQRICAGEKTCPGDSRSGGKGNFRSLFCPDSGAASHRVGVTREPAESRWELFRTTSRASVLVSASGRASG